MDFSHALAQLPKANFISANVRPLFETIATTYVNNENSERVYLAAETLASVINNCASQLPKESMGLFQLLSSVSLFT